MCFAIVAIAVFLLAPSNVLAQEQAEQPRFGEGDVWVFRISRSNFVTSESSRLRDGEYKVATSKKRFRFFSLAGNQEEEIKPGEGVNLWVLRRMIGIIGRDKYPPLQFPLFVGKEWSGEYTLIAPAGADAPMTTFYIPYKSKVTATEKVTTSAGTFTAFKIEREDSYPGSLGLSAFFYSPATKGIVKYRWEGVSYRGGGESKMEIELIKFGSAAK